MRILLLSVILLCSSCASYTVTVKQDAHIERLGIFLDIGEHAPPLIAERFGDQLEDFILRHNADPRRKFDVFRASANDSTTLRIKLLATRMVTSGQQVGGAIVSAIGLTLPFVLISAEAPIIVLFYYFPTMRSMTELSLSEDINQNKPPVRGYQLASPGFLLSPEKQITKHVVSFDALLRSLTAQIGKQVQVRKKESYVAR